MVVEGIDVPGHPDLTAAGRVRAGFRRLSWQEIDLTAGAPRCSVRGIRHRLPGARPITVGAALALAATGLPTVVRVAPREAR